MKAVQKGSAAILSLALLASLTACGVKEDKTPASTATAAATAKTVDSAKPVKLRIVWWGAQARHDATMKALDLYTKKHPNVTFEPEFSGFDGYFQKLATQAAAGNAPDIIQMDAAYLAEYAGRNQLADLSAGVNTADLDKSLLDTGKYKSKQYAIPLGNNALGIIYNKAALEKLGVSAPKSDWTWDDYFKMGQDAKAKLSDGKFPLLNSLTDYVYYDLYQLGKGKGNAVTIDGKFNIDKTVWTEWVNKHQELMKQGVMPPAEKQVTDKVTDPKLDLLLNDTILVRRAYAAEFPGYDTAKQNTFGLVKAPRATQASGYLKPSMFWSVSANSKNTEESKKFIDWFINDPEVGDVLGTTRGIPVAQKVRTSLDSKLTATDKTQIELISKTAPDANPFNPGAQGWGNFQKDYTTIMETLMFAKTTPDKAYDELVKKAKEYEKATPAN
ncbi:ABC transporter substrate-binding protein [Paenibacillus sp. N3.4]|uniref:ABC transporter substrate-binding protein n=1 Tax=Paenibacillus sp. N3.4 TaxID=2603222 RepID=UPI0011C978EB|nr:extracellular solute-binding protein [Paenibacillus sp. N3.4]TXK82611.1 extracellular solute-binding protein [Paenibacillus sp. N3.4]